MDGLGELWLEEIKCRVGVSRTEGPEGAHGCICMGIWEYMDV